MSSAHSVEAQHSEEITYIRANFQKAKGQLLSEFRLAEAMTSRPPAALSKSQYNKLVYANSKKTELLVQLQQQLQLLQSNPARKPPAKQVRDLSRDIALEELVQRQLEHACVTGRRTIVRVT